MHSARIWSPLRIDISEAAHAKSKDAQVSSTYSTSSSSYNFRSSEHCDASASATAYVEAQKLVDIRLPFSLVKLALGLSPQFTIFQGDHQHCIHIGLGMERYNEMKA